MGHDPRFQLTERFMRQTITTEEVMEGPYATERCPRTPWRRYAEDKGRLESGDEGSGREMPARSRKIVTQMRRGAASENRHLRNARNEDQSMNSGSPLQRGFRRVLSGKDSKIGVQPTSGRSPWIQLGEDLAQTQQGSFTRGSVPAPDQISRSPAASSVAERSNNGGATSSAHRRMGEPLLSPNGEDPRQCLYEINAQDPYADEYLLAAADTYADSDEEIAAAALQAGFYGYDDDASAEHHSVLSSDAGGREFGGRASTLGSTSGGSSAGGRCGSPRNPVPSCPPPPPAPVTCPPKKKKPACPAQDPPKCPSPACPPDPPKCPEPEPVPQCPPGCCTCSCCPPKCPSPPICQEPYKCPKVKPSECPPLRRLEPEPCDPKEIMKARQEAQCAVRAKLDALCNKPGKGSSSGPCPAGKKADTCARSPCQGSKSPCAATSSVEICGNVGGSGSDACDEEPPCCDQPDAENMCEGLDCVQTWQKDTMDTFLENQRNWRRGTQPSTPSKKRHQLVEREPLILPDSVQQFVDRVKCGGGNECAPIALPTHGRVMDEVEQRTVLEIKCELEKEGATTYGLPGDVKIDFVHLLTSEVWCERSRISLELKLLRKMLARATEEAECARGTADDAYGGGQSECYVKEFKRIMDCLKPLRDRRRLVHHKAQSVCRAVTDATRILYDPLDWGICSLTAKRTGESPVGRMMSNLGSDMLRQAYALFGVEFSKCTNFPERFGRELKNELASAAWASNALCEYLQLRGPHFPDIIPEDPDELNCEGPMPPTEPVAFNKWATMRDVYLLYKEAHHFRQVMKSHDFVDKEVACTFPAFPEKDRRCIFNGYVTPMYLEDNVGLWRGKWAIRHAIVNRTTANPVG